MKVIIDISDDVYVRLFDNGNPFEEAVEELEKEYQTKDYDEICTAIRSGTVVPKGFKVKVTND